MVWNCLMNVAIGLFGIQEGPFIDILEIESQLKRSRICGVN